MNRRDIYYPNIHAYSDKQLQAQTSRYAQFDTSVIPPIIKQELKLTVTKITPSSDWGSAHVIYFLKIKNSKQKLLFRANTGPKTPERYMLVEKLVTDRVAKFEVPVNKILVVDVSREKFPFDYQIQEKLPGQIIEGKFTGTKSEYDELSRQLGKFVAKYHILTFDNFGFFNEDHAAETGKLRGLQKSFYSYILNNLAEDIKELVQAKTISSSVGNNITKIFEENEKLCTLKRGSLIHHDLADHNITYQRNKITGIFDWEVCGVGDPILDIASCLTWKTYHPRLKPFLEGYTQVTSLPKNFEEKKHLYVLRTILWKTVNGLKRNILTKARLSRLKDALLPYQIKI